MYGAWIKPSGDIVDCPDKCSHQQYCSYNDADEDGWISVIYGGACYSTEINGSFGDNFRLNIENITLKALSTMAKIIRQSSEQSFFIEDIFSNKIDGITRQGMPKITALKHVKDFREKIRNKYP